MKNVVLIFATSHTVSRQLDMTTNYYYVLLIILLQLSFSYFQIFDGTQCTSGQSHRMNLECVTQDSIF